MEVNFPFCMKFVFAREGGYVDNPADPGGATNLGVTFATLKAWRKTSITKQDVKDLTKEEATAIYHAWYWSDAWCEALPPGVDLLTYDVAVNAGVGRALDFLKLELGLPLHAGKQHYPAHRNRADPKMPFVFEALMTRTPQDLVAGLCERRRHFYRSLSTFHTFGVGWLRRVDQAERVALQLCNVNGLSTQWRLNQASRADAHWVSPA